jgi:hypothetical protein
MNSTDQMAALGLKPSDYETGTLERLSAAAKEFEKQLNSFPGLVEATLESIEYGSAGGPTRNKFYLKVRHVQKVF